MENMRRLIAGNWKMNNLAARAEQLVQAIDNHSKSIINNKCDLLICPSANLLQMISKQLVNSPIMIGAQDCHFEEKGAFTGEISAKMLVDVGASYVLLGHSERRHGLFETDNVVRAKVKAAHKESLITIICVCETDIQKENGETLIELLKGADLDNSGAIDYTEFIAATIDCHTYLKVDYLKTAFDMFDKDRSGKIDKNELL